MSSVNQVTLLGRLGRDPEARNFQNGGKVVNLRLATSERWKDRTSGEQKERTEWHSVCVFGPLADIAERYLRKGSLVLLQGQLQTRKWQDKDGQERFNTEVVLQGFGANLVLLDRREGGEAPAREPARGGGGTSARPVDDDIPFAPEWR